VVVFKPGLTTSSARALSARFARLLG
jgi:hypothetical protein